MFYGGFPDRLLLSAPLRTSIQLVLDDLTSDAHDTRLADLMIGHVDGGGGGLAHAAALQAFHHFVPGPKPAVRARQPLRYFALVGRAAMIRS